MLFRSDRESVSAFDEYCGCNRGSHQCDSWNTCYGRGTVSYTHLTMWVDYLHIRDDYKLESDIMPDRLITEFNRALIAAGDVYKRQI